MADTIEPFDLIPPDDTEITWVRFLFHQFNDDIAGLTPVEISVYAVICGLVPSLGQPILENDERIRRSINVRGRHIQDAIDKLVAKGRLQVAGISYLGDGSAVRKVYAKWTLGVCKAAATRMLGVRKAGKKSAESRAQTQQPIPSREREIDSLPKVPLWESWTMPADWKAITDPAEWPPWLDLDKLRDRIEAYVRRFIGCIDAQFPEQVYTPTDDDLETVERWIAINQHDAFDLTGTINSALTSMRSRGLGLPRAIAAVQPDLLVLFDTPDPESGKRRWIRGQQIAHTPPEERGSPEAQEARRILYAPAPRRVR